LGAEREHVLPARRMRIGVPEGLIIDETGLPNMAVHGVGIRDLVRSAHGAAPCGHHVRRWVRRRCRAPRPRPQPSSAPSRKNGAGDPRGWDQDE